MSLSVLVGLLIPFLGTALGASTVFFWGRARERDEAVMQGLAAGVMVAASIWSLLIPAFERSHGLGIWSPILVCLGLWSGVVFLLLLGRCESRMSGGRLSFAVTLHNIPEGMAVGVIFAAYLAGEGEVSLAAAFAFSLGIGIQNVPEGAIISLPAYAGGKRKGHAFGMGLLSGVVEPVFAAFSVVLAYYVGAVLPFLLAFAAGAMLLVVTEELLPAAAKAPHHLGALAALIGFTLMMLLDVLLG